MKGENLPPLPLPEWEDSRLYWQLMCQVVGKVRLKMHAPINHWWHVPLYVSPRGLTTGTIANEAANFDMELDLVDMGLRIRSENGQAREVPLKPRPIADYYRDTMDSLASLGIHPHVVAKPYGCKSEVPFPDDREHASFDPEAVRRGWTVLKEIEPVFEEFRGRFIGKCSPVHMFWHSFDLAVTRFSGRRGSDMSAADRVTQEAYSHEVNSAGFWFGDDSVPEAAFYCYSAPAPVGLATEPLKPKEAYWMELRGAPMALLRYEDVRRSSDPKGMVLDFLQSSYEAGANLAKWNRDELERS